MDPGAQEARGTPGKRKRRRGARTDLLTQAHQSPGARRDVASAPSEWASSSAPLTRFWLAGRWGRGSAALPWDCPGGKGHPASQCEGPDCRGEETGPSARGLLCVPDSWVFIGTGCPQGHPVPGEKRLPVSTPFVPKPSHPSHSPHCLPRHSHTTSTPPPATWTGTTPEPRACHSCPLPVLSSPSTPPLAPRAPQQGSGQARGFPSASA